MLKRKRRGDALQIVDKAIGQIERQMESGELKGSMADLVRLPQMRKEESDLKPQRVTVRWVDACQTTPAIEE